MQRLDWECLWQLSFQYSRLAHGNMAIKGSASTVCESLLLHGIVIVPVIYGHVIYVLYVIFQKRHMLCHICHMCSDILYCFCIDAFAKSKGFGRHRYGSMTTMWWSWNLQTAGDDPRLIQASSDGSVKKSADEDLLPDWTSEDSEPRELCFGSVWSTCMVIQAKLAAAWLLLQKRHSTVNEKCFTTSVNMIRFMNAYREYITWTLNVVLKAWNKRKGAQAQEVVK